jgi:peptide/nickel transport system substrate-binding protein
MTSGQVLPANRARSRTRRLIAGALSAATLFAASAVGAAPTASAASDKTLTAAMNFSGIDTLNPFLAFFDGALDTFGLIYPSLNQLDRTGKAGPYLAKSWTTSADKLTWTFTLQDGLKWSDGQPLTAADAAWTFNLIMTNSDAATANGSLVANFASVTATNPTTLVIKTKVAQSNLLYVTPPIVPQHIWEAHVAGLKTYKNNSYPVVGYGPWVLTQYATDQFEKFDANKNFKLGAAGPPKYDKLVLQVFKNGDAAVAALKSNQISYLHNMQNSNEYNALKGDSSVQTVQEVGSRWTAMEINSGAKTKSGKKIGTGNPALADPELRRAIHLAIDKKKLVSTVIGGLGVPGSNYLPPAFPQWAWTPSGSQAVSYDPAKANSVLDAAGYTKGSDGMRVDPKTHKKLNLRLGIHSDDSRDSQTSQFLKGWLKAIGINLKIESQSMTALNANLAKGDWDMLMDGWGTGADPTYLFSIQTCGTLPKDDGSGGNTDAFYCNPQFDNLFTQQVAAFDESQRKQVVGQMQSILYDANADIILYYANLLDAVRKASVSKVIVGSPNTEGLYPLQTVFWSYLDASTPGGKSSKKSSSSSALLYGGIAIVVVLLVAGGVALRRRSTATERE